jgi:LmbE family N-acetylglucosaminyl deacetylase
MNSEPGSVLAVMAHPDDAELWTGGTLALHARTVTVTVAVVRADDERMREAADGARILGATLRELPTQTTATDLRDLLLAVQPDIVITHPHDDMHADHRRIAALLLEALPEVVIATGRPMRLYSCDTYNSLTLNGPVDPHTIIDISETYEVKMQALATHSGTQPIAAHFAPMARISPASGAPESAPTTLSPTPPFLSSDACPALCDSDTSQNRTGKGACSPPPTHRPGIAVVDQGATWRLGPCWAGDAIDATSLGYWA